MATTVLHVTTRLGGGIATAIHQYADSLPEARHALASSNIGWSPGPEYYSAFSAVHHLPAGWAQARSVVCQLASTQMYDVVHAHSSHAGALVRTITGGRTRLVYTPHGYATLSPRFSRSWLTGQAERLLGMRSITIAAVSDDEAIRARRLAPTSRVVRLTNLPTVTTMSPVLFDQPLRVVGCGRLTPQKDPEYFAEVARLSRNAGLPHLFTWIGDGSPRSRLVLEEAGVVVTGWVPGGEVTVRLASYNVLLHSARYEGAPFAVLDAAALGLPVIARSVPGLEELTWIEHVGEPHEAVRALRVLSGETVWSAASARVRLSVHGLTPALQGAQLRRAYGL